jgi:hypothetical protein
VQIEALDRRSSVLGDACRSAELERIVRYANAHNLSLVGLRRWRDLLDSGEVEIDWRAYLHPSAWSGPLGPDRDAFND